MKQTGDVLYFKTNSIPNGFNKIKGNLIHQGQNHKHIIIGKFQLFTNDKGDMIIECKSPCIMRHDEHEDVVVDKGLYKKDIVKEYDHFKEEARRVID